MPTFEEHSRIAVTDSGLGGLSVLIESLRLMPSERFVYLADQAYMPYGDKPRIELMRRLEKVADFLRAWPSKAIVLACNTATAAAAKELRARTPDWPIVGIEPAVKPAIMLSRTGKVGILATSNTLASEKFADLVSRFESVAEVTAQPCPGLVELIEQTPRDETAIRTLLQPRVSALLDKGVDVLVLGCTHYPFVRQTIELLAGQNVQVIDTGFAVARQLLRRLQEAGLAVEKEIATPDSAFELPPIDLSHALAQVQFLTTGGAEEFRLQLTGLLGAGWASAHIEAVTIA